MNRTGSWQRWTARDVDALVEFTDSIGLPLDPWQVHWLTQSIAPAPARPESAGPLDTDAEHRRLTAPLGDLGIAHRVTLRVLAERPDDPKVQEQWAGRLQGMAMQGLVWRFPGKPWQITRYAQSLLDADTSPPSPADVRKVVGKIDVTAESLRQPPLLADPSDVDDIEAGSSCARCGSTLVWDDCATCEALGCGADDPDPRCVTCSGSGRMATCLSSNDWCVSNPLPGAADVPRHTPSD